jgi:hypothetical protein
MDLPGLSPEKRTEDAGKFVVDTRKHNLQDVIRPWWTRSSSWTDVEYEPLEDIIAEFSRVGPNGKPGKPLERERRRDHEERDPFLGPSDTARRGR